VRNLIDTHAHLCDPSFDEDRGEVLQRALEAGIAGVVCVGEDLADARRNLELAAEHPMLLPAAGLFPSPANSDAAREAAGFIREERRRLRAIGEVGLDYWIAKTGEQREAQREALRLFAALSLELDLPLNVHSRSAGLHTVELLLEAGASRVQMHAFDGKASAALRGVEAGFLFSVPPSVVRSRQKQKLARALPLEALLLETDSPVLGPAPGVRNEPANLLIAADAVAGLKGLPRERVLEAAAENAARLYALA
jgi:TatD DNase family protein